MLFVTRADRPFTESERGFLEQIREWGKKIVFVVNKIDILPRPEDREQVLGFVREQRPGAPGRGAPPLSGLRPRGAGGPRGRLDRGVARKRIGRVDTTSCGR